MNQNLIKFQSIPWEQPKTGVQQKIYSDGKRRLRLLQFHDTFIEEDWCQKGHVGYVLSGEMTIDFNGTLKHYQQGDGLWIEAGESSKHKVLMKEGKSVELILFESEE